MIDKEIIKIFNKRILIEIAEQHIWVRSEIERIKNEMNARGTLRSGITIMRVASLCKDAVKNKSQLIWQTLFRFITTPGISYSPTLADELKGLVAQYLPEKLGDLKGYIKQTAEFAGSPNMSDSLEQGLDSARKQALARVGTEIDLFVHSLKKKASTEKDETSSAVINIYSPVGSIQTGDYSISTVTQNIDTEVKEQIRKTLEEINTTLIQPEVETPTPKSELIEVVQESQKEIEKARPNVTKLRSLLSTVGTSIRVVSSLKPAYETLKQVLTFIGISLP